MENYTKNRLKNWKADATRETGVVGGVDWVQTGNLEPVNPGSAGWDDMVSDE